MIGAHERFINDRRRIWLALLPTLILSACFMFGTSASASGDIVYGEPYRVAINGLNQTVMIHTRDTSNPVLLVLHGGPGYAMLPLMHELNPQIEDDFTIVNWDQRGAGLTLETQEANMTLNQFVDDAYELTLWLKQEFGQQKIYILGHSFGTVLGIYLIKLYPENFFSFVGIGQTVNVIENEQYGYDWAYQQAIENGDQRARDLLDAVGRPRNDGYYPGEVPLEYADEFESGSDVTIHYVSVYGGDVYGAENASTHNAI